MVAAMRVLAHLSHGPRSPVLALLLLASACFAPTGKDPSTTTEASSSAAATTTAPGTSTDAPTTGPAPTSSGPSDTTSTTAPDTTSTGTTAPPDTTATATATSDPGTSTGTTTGDTSTGTTGTDNNCGNGVVDGDEQCDDGAENANNHACTAKCQLNTCGDGLICPTCDQQCDDGNITDNDGCSASCKFEYRYAFTTKAVFKGKLIGGVIGGDSLCNEAAKAAPDLKGRSFRAWLSKDVETAKQRLGSDPLPVRRTDGMPLADNTPALSAGALMNSINSDEFGQPVGAVAPCGDPKNYVWTGTFADGNVDLDGVCDNWSAGGMLGRFGNFSVATASWTSCGTGDCGLIDAHLYCVEVP